MAYGGLNKEMDAAAEIERNPARKHQIPLENGDEQADAGRDCRNRLAKPNSQVGANEDREIFIFPVQLTTSRIGNLTRLIHTLAICSMCDQYVLCVQLGVICTRYTVLNF